MKKNLFKNKSFNKGTQKKLLSKHKNIWKNLMKLETKKIKNFLTLTKKMLKDLELLPLFGKIIIFRAFLNKMKTLLRELIKILLKHLHLSLLK